MRVFGGERIASLMGRLKVDEETPIENRLISKSLEGAQKKVEGFHFDQRKNVVQYDNVMNRHRKATYIMRREILQAIDIKQRVLAFIEDEAHAIATSSLLTSDDLEDALRMLFRFDEQTLDRIFDTETDKFESVLVTIAKEFYESRESAFTPEIMRKVERDVYLQILDNLWMQHLESMDHLRQGIHWISVGQRDPLVEYRRQAQRLFDAMQGTLRHNVLTALFHAEPVSTEQLERPVETAITRAARRSISNSGQIVADQEEFDASDFQVNAKTESIEKKKIEQKRKKARKAERQRRTKGRKHH
jgi:preprotein translocase subunit SecA